MSDLDYIATAAAALGDRHANPARINQRLNDIERALSRPLPKGERDALRREYIDLTDARDAA